MWSGRGDSNSRIRNGTPAHCQLCYARMVVAEGIEPSTSRLSTPCSAELSYATWQGRQESNPHARGRSPLLFPLSYAPGMAEKEGFEPPGLFARFFSKEVQ